MKNLDKRPPVPNIEWEWYSICSKHSKYDQNCKNCNSGRWISSVELDFDRWLWTYSKELWKKWANQNNKSVSNWMQKIFK